MSIELIALLSLFVAIAIGYFTNVNTGVLGIAMAFLVGTFLADMTGKEIIAGFPTSTFVTLMSMTFLFSIAKVNGTMETMAYKVIQLAKGKTKLIPHLFFVFAAILSAVGAGPIVTPALLCPIATSVGKKENIKDIIMLMCVICGGLVGGLTPFGPSGIVASTLFESSGIAPYTPVMLSAVVIHIVQYAVVFTIIGGWKIKTSGSAQSEEVPSFNKNQWLTVAVILCVVLAAMFLGWDIALVALLGSSVLLILKASDQAKSIVGVPWGTLLLVGGVSVLINVINSVGYSVIIRCAVFDHERKHSVFHYLLYGRSVIGSIQCVRCRNADIDPYGYRDFSRFRWSCGTGGIRCGSLLGCASGNLFTAFYDRCARLLGSQC